MNNKFFLFCVSTLMGVALSAMESQPCMTQSDFVARFSLNAVQKYFLKAYFGDSLKPIAIQHEGDVSVAMFSAPGTSGAVFACKHGGTFFKVYGAKNRCIQNRCSGHCASCDTIARELIEYPGLATMMAGLGSRGKFEYPDSRLFRGIILGAESGNLPVSLCVSTEQFRWLMGKWGQGAFAPTRYNACVSSITLTDKNYNSVTLDRCCLSDPNSCCAIKQNGEVLVPCEKHGAKKQLSSYWGSFARAFQKPFVRWQTWSIRNAAFCAGLYMASKIPGSWVEYCKNSFMR